MQHQTGIPSSAALASLSHRLRLRRHGHRGHRGPARERGGRREATRRAAHHAGGARCRPCSSRRAVAGPAHPPRAGRRRRRGCPAGGRTGAGPERQRVEPAAPGSCAQSGTGLVVSQEDSAGEGIPPRFLGKSHFAQFSVSSRCFIPHAEFLKGVRMQHLGRKCLRAGPSPALGCHLCPGTGPGRRRGPCAVVLLPGGVCPCHLLMAEAPAAHSTFPHAPVRASISHQSVPVSQRGRAHWLPLRQRREMPVLVGDGWLLCLHRVLGAGPALPAAWQAQGLKQFFALL